MNEREYIIFLFRKDPSEELMPATLIYSGDKMARSICTLYPDGIISAGTFELDADSREGWLQVTVKPHDPNYSPNALYNKEDDVHVDQFFVQQLMLGYSLREYPSRFSPSERLQARGADHWMHDWVKNLYEGVK